MVMIINTIFQNLNQIVIVTIIVMVVIPFILSYFDFHHHLCGVYCILVQFSNCYGLKGEPRVRGPSLLLTSLL